MNNYPNQIPPRFVPVPAVPITVMLHRKGECIVSVDGRVVTGATLREALSTKESAR